LTFRTDSSPATVYCITTIKPSTPVQIDLAVSYNKARQYFVIGVVCEALPTSGRLRLAVHRQRPEDRRYRSDYRDAFLEEQFTAGLGYEGRISRRARWYAEGFYQHYRLGEDFNDCNYTCKAWYKAWSKRSLTAPWAT
jgi:hypothetical protein